MKELSFDQNNKVFARNALEAKAKKVDKAIHLWEQTYSFCNFL
tara:strand:+ start:300 stop:428 length:129 start_codon:yes stop_codon:yes gene_type:complete